MQTEQQTTEEQMTIESETARHGHPPIDMGLVETTPASPECAAVALAEHRLLEARTAVDLDEELLEKAKAKSAHEANRLTLARAEAEQAQAKLADLDPDDPQFAATHAAQLLAEAKIASLSTLADRAAVAATKATTDHQQAKQAVIEAAAEVEIAKLQMVAAPLREILAAAALEAEKVLAKMKIARDGLEAAVALPAIAYERPRLVIAPRAEKKAAQLEPALLEAVEVAEALIQGVSRWEAFAKQREQEAYERSPAGIAELQAKDLAHRQAVYLESRRNALQIGNPIGPDGLPWRAEL